MRVHRDSFVAGPRPPSGAEILATQEPEPNDDFIFDPRRDIDPETKDLLIDELDSFRFVDWREFGEKAWRYLILFPDEKGKLRLSETSFIEMKKVLEDYRGKRWFDNFVRMAMIMCSLFPDRRNEYNLSGSEFDEVKAVLDHFIENGALRAYCGLAACLFSLYPNRRDQLGLDKELFDKLNDDMNSCRETEPFLFLEMAKNMSILFPDFKNELGLDEPTFLRMKELLKSKRYPEDLLVFSKVAVPLAVISAKRVDVDSEGKWILTPEPKALGRPSPPLPERSAS
jgi:hypothetical protein